MFGKKAKAEKPKSTSNEKVAVTDAGPCEKSLHLQVGPEVIGPVRAAVLEEFRKRAELPGFRKGKAPADLVEQRNGQAIQDETLHRVTRQAFEQVIKDHDLKPVGPFELSRTDFQPANGLTLEAKVEVEPDFALGSYKGIALTREAVTVTPEEIEQGLKGFQESMAQLVPKGEGQPKEKTVPPINDELAKDIGFENLEKLKTHVEAKLREQKRTAQAQALEAKLSQELLSRHAFEVPPKLVERQAERVQRDFKTRLLMSGMDETKVNEEMQRFAQRLRESATEHVKLSFILDRIAAQESMAVKEDEVVGRLWQLARRWKKDPSEVRKIFDDQGLWPSVISTMRQEKTMVFLMDAAAIDDGGAG